jgi:hypothetical protein
MSVSYFRLFPKSFKLDIKNLYDGIAARTWAEQYFDTQSTTYYGVLKRWNGSSWVKAKMSNFNGVSFVPSVLKFYDGSSFKLIDTTGI